MEDGLLNKKVGFIIQARMQSTRLPGKILMPLPLGNGKPLLSWIIDELKKSTFKSKIIVATSLNKENDILESFCETNEIECYRGDEENVLSRFTTIVKNEYFDCIVRLTADNPILDIDILDNTIEKHFTEQNEYTSTVGLPIGMNFEVMDANALLDSLKHKLTLADKEHVTLFIKNSGLYKLAIFKPAVNPLLVKLRLTVDYPSDYALISSILSQSSVENGKKGTELVEETFKLYPWLFETNSTNFQKVQFNDLSQEVKAAITFLNQYDFNRTAELLDKINI